MIVLPNYGPGPETPLHAVAGTILHPNSGRDDDYPPGYAGARVDEGRSLLTLWWKSTPPDSILQAIKAADPSITIKLHVDAAFSLDEVMVAQDLLMGAGTVVAGCRVVYTMPNTDGSGLTIGYEPVKGAAFSPEEVAAEAQELTRVSITRAIRGGTVDLISG